MNKDVIDLHQLARIKFPLLSISFVEIFPLAATKGKKQAYIEALDFQIASAGTLE